MNDEGNAVVEAAPIEDITSSSDAVIQDTTTPSDIGPVPTPPLATMQGGDVPAPTYTTPLAGSKLNDLQIIEMLDQTARSNIYSQHELTKAGFDSELTTAKTYNTLKERQLALAAYEVKSSAARIRAEHTGWFITPEDEEMVTQYKTAKYYRDLGGMTSSELQKANNVIAQTEGFFKQKGISMKGVETLQKILYERELAVERGKLAAASAAQYNDMIKAEEHANLAAVLARLDVGQSPAYIAAAMEGIVDKQTVYTIAKGYVGKTGDSVLAMKRIMNLTYQSDTWNRLVKDTGEKSLNGDSIYTYTYKGSTHRFAMEPRRDSNNNIVMGPDGVPVYKPTFVFDTKKPDKITETAREDKLAVINKEIKETSKKLSFPEIKYLEWYFGGQEGEPWMPDYSNHVGPTNPQVQYGTRESWEFFYKNKKRMTELVNSPEALRLKELLDEREQYVIEPKKIKDKPTLTDINMRQINDRAVSF